MDFYARYVGTRRPVKEVPIGGLDNYIWYLDP